MKIAKFMMIIAAIFYAAPLMAEGLADDHGAKKKKSGKWQLVFEDNFDGNKLNPSHWEIINGNGCPQLCGFGNDELQAYSGENLTVKDGFLTITAEKRGGMDRPYKSGKITTKPMGGWKYGKFSIRAKLAHGVGAWSAIWMMPQKDTYGIWPKSGEIDITEHVGHELDTIFSTIHTQSYNHMNGNDISKRIKLKGSTDNFHTYTLIWKEDRLIWEIDGKKFFTIKKKSGDTSDEWPFDNPFHLILNVAVGGKFGGQKGVTESHFPTTMVVDWVKVWQAP